MGRMTASQLISVLLLVGIATTEAKFYSAAIARERLITDLFVNYDPSQKPTLKSKCINVSVNIEIQHFDFHEPDGSFRFVGLFDVSWQDSHLAWNPSDYNNLTKIPVSQKYIWVPDLEMYNNAPDKFLRMHRNGIVVLDKDGNVLWTDTIELMIFCTTNMQNWPHDHHACKLSLGSWTYDGYELDIIHTDPNISMNFDEHDVKNTKYRIINFTAKHVTTLYNCCEEPYITIDYYITFERRSSYAIIFRMPAFCVILLTLLALIMEPQRSEKIILNGISLIIITLNLIYFASNIGRFTRKTPFIVTFYGQSLILVTMAQLLAVFSLFATRSRYRGKLPLFCTRFLKSSFAYFVASTYVNKSDHEHLETHSQFEDVKLQEFSNLLSGSSFTHEWVHLARIFERIAFALFAFVFLILGTVCFI